MVKLVNIKVGALLPIIDEKLCDYITFSTTCDIPEHILTAFEKCLKAVLEQMESDKLFDGKNRMWQVNCIVTDNDLISIEVDDEFKAVVMDIIIYPIHKWSGLRSQMICACIVEELCHYFWNIRSEYDVVFKVIQVLKRINPNIKISDVYNLDKIRQIAVSEGKAFTAQTTEV